ncbi:hypothetical protein JQ636_25100 [Bradyrhizobium japonicum]|uniref:hypothetical protein n=1 Tax=Bradyrhizobium japonicum TaxID=375 RepID=UPI001BA87302|nr:hypothetical protein [Bradyrhizobium japonicum]MBR0806830.1 hypothetical protein [Bradyrhizobium japonicum]
MESTNAYFDRKFEELKLLNSCLAAPLSLDRPGSVADVIRCKFQLTAALRAAHEMRDWNATETAWAGSARPFSGPFNFQYDYQRADLAVEGPSFYALDERYIRQTIYTASGMAAIASLLLAFSKSIGDAEVIALPGSYGETLELIGSYVPQLYLMLDSVENFPVNSNSRRILLLDSCIASRDFRDVVNCGKLHFDLIIFDTTCFASSSGRIRQVVQWSCRQGIPLILVRSHNKLDSLGVEYGRLGSITLVRNEFATERIPLSCLEELMTETRNAIRLLGNAALPAHFPPFVGTSFYLRLTRKRTASILRNGRFSSRHFASRLRGVPSQLQPVHGLYVTLGSHEPLDETAARQAATAMSEELSEVGFPIRHAGSFGFDFAATEWFHDLTADRYSVRIAAPDLPLSLWRDLTQAIGDWWLASIS